MNNKPRILIFTGDGKGKTTAALGMALRASGHGMKTLVVQFVKRSDTGEITAADKMENINIVQTGLGFLPDPGSKNFAKHIQAAEKALSIVDEAIASGNYDFVVLDEICVAVDKGLLEEKNVAKVIAGTDPKISLVLTGRNASQGLIDLADTVSDIQCVKHGYKTGIPAQKGVEF